MKLSTIIGGWPSDAPGQAAKAEENGYDMVSCGELAHDSMLTMALAATGTEKIELMTSVTIAFPRSPMVLAMEAWDIQQLSKGRFNIGLGSQVKGHNERRFGGTWSAAAPRMKEYSRWMTLNRDPERIRRDTRSSTTCRFSTSASPTSAVTPGSPIAAMTRARLSSLCLYRSTVHALEPVGRKSWSSVAGSSIVSKRFSTL